MSDENPTTSFMQAMERIEDGGRTHPPVTDYEWSLLIAERNAANPTLPPLLGPRGVPIRLKLLHPNATVPKYAHDGDSGMDLAALEAWTLAPHSRCKIQLGIAVGLPAGYEAQIRPRSSLSAKGIVCAFGTIDQGYTGELAAVLYNLTDDVVSIDAGQRICQLVIAPVARAEMVQVETFEQTSRGDGGFGSTDKVKP